MIRQYYYDQLCVQYHQSQVAQVGADHHWQVSQLLVTIWSHSSSSVLCPVLSRASATKDLKTYPLMIIKTFVHLYPLDKEDGATQFFSLFFSTHFSLACQELKINSTQLQPLDTKDVGSNDNFSYKKCWFLQIVCQRGNGSQDGELVQEQDTAIKQWKMKWDLQQFYHC